MDADVDLDLDLVPPLPAGRAPALYWTAECPACGRTITADADDVFRFLRGRWPDCCGIARTFHIVCGDPSPADGAKA
jgi:hypothetical protein